MDTRRLGIVVSRTTRRFRRAGAFALAVVLVLAAAGVASGAATTNATSVATDQTFSGFTVGAAVVAVLLGGTYWYYRRG